MNADSPCARGYLRHPTIHADTVVFACEDDLWRVGAAGGAASRLTAGISEYCHPRLSPDGASIAFVAADEGPTEVYVIAADGGPATRLTFQAARCAVVGWHPRTGEILYASTADQPAGFGYRLFAVAPDGSGPARPLGLGPASSVSFGPDGGAVLGRSIAEPARWKRYRGGAAGDLWIDVLGRDRFEPLPTPEGNVASPCWVDGRIYFISDHEGVGNVYSCRPDGSGLTRHSDHREYYARNLSSDGRRLVYHAGARLYLLDPGSGPGAEGPESSHVIQVGLPAAGSQHARRFAPAVEYLESAGLGPDGNAVALVARGQAFTMAHWSGPVRRHGALEGARHRLLHWLADGLRLVAVEASEEAGERLVVLPGEGGAARTRIALDTGLVVELSPAPVGGLVAFTTGRQELWIVDVDARPPRPELLDASRFERIEDLSWSPDGRWLAYAYPATLRTTAIKLAEVAERRAHEVTRPILHDCRPVFDPCGRYLYFIGQRELTPRLDQVEFGVGFPFGSRPYLITLRADEPSPFVQRPDFLDGPGEPGAAEQDHQVERDDRTGPPPWTQIDLDGIDRRIVPFPVAEGRYTGIVARPECVLLHTLPANPPDPQEPRTGPEGVVVRVDLATSEVDADYLSPVDEIGVSADGRALLYRHGERLRVLKGDIPSEEAEEYNDKGAKPGRRTGWLDLDRVKVAVHPSAEWRQMFREAWRLQREGFWSARMAGIDWDAMYERYRPLARRVGSRAELSDLIWELQGELGTSHAYEHGGDYQRPEEHAQGFLGLDFRLPNAREVARVLRGDPWVPDATSPCNRPGTDIRPGDFIEAVDGRPVGPAGPGELLVGHANHEVELTVRRAGAELRTVVVKAIGSQARARYLDWVEETRAHVHAASNGRIGYLHVPDMTQTGFADFVRGFLTELDREALMVDVRFNGGGFISPLLLDRLSRRRGGAEHGRWSGVAPYPLEAPRGPIAVLINEHTGSDGEVFSHMVRARGIGTLIGRRTWGGVVATWPRHQLVDGSVTTQPEYRYFFDDIGDRLENRGVEPDLEVAPGPRGEGSPHDAQLDAAVEYLLLELDPHDARAHRQRRRRAFSRATGSDPRGTSGVRG